MHYVLTHYLYMLSKPVIPAEITQQRYQYFFYCLRKMGTFVGNIRYIDDMNDMNDIHCPIVIIGGGLTGLSLASQLDMEGVPFLLLESKARLGGQVCTLKEGGFTFEVGPNTGTVSTPEVIELFEYAAPEATLEEASSDANDRWVWKGDRFHSIPNGLWSGLTTPLYSFRDKLRVPFEPFRKRGTDPNESVGALAERRLGKSIVEYSVDPFVGGVYAGDPYMLVTRLALPKLYNLEQMYGSFVKGAMHKAKEPKSERDKKATKKIFSAEGGLEELIKAVAKKIVRTGKVELCSRDISIVPVAEGWVTQYTDSEGVRRKVLSKRVVTTVRADILPALFEQEIAAKLGRVATLPYAPVTEVCVGFDHLPNIPRAAFGALVPSKEQRDVLGILFPSSCFRGRTPYPDGALFTIFMGGIRNRELVEGTTPQFQEELALAELYSMMKIPHEVRPDMVHVAHYPKAIPQYDLGTEERLQDIKAIESQYPGLHLAGGIRDGIGMANRITQGMQLGIEICKELKCRDGRDEK